MKTWLVILLGGGLGSVFRYLISIWFKQNYAISFPWHTLLINITGCLLIGIAYAAFLHQTNNTLWQLFILVGLLGGYTTFSSFGLETFELLKQRQFLKAIAYVLGSNFAGIAAVFAGYWLKQQFRA